MQRFLFDTEKCRHLFAGGAMNALIGHRIFPLPQESVLIGQALKGVSFKSIAFDIFDARFRFAFVFETARQTGQKGRAIMTAETFQLGIEFWITPVGSQNCRLQIVDVQSFGNPAEGSESILQTTDECFSILSQHRLAESLA